MLSDIQICLAISHVAQRVVFSSHSVNDSSENFVNDINILQCNLDYFNKGTLYISYEKDLTLLLIRISTLGLSLDKIFDL